jgi:hypothetical protein
VTRQVLVALSLVAAGLPAGADTGSASGSLAVAVTVARSCAIETSTVESTGTSTIRCTAGAGPAARQSLQPADAGPEPREAAGSSVLTIEF